MKLHALASTSTRSKRVYQLHHLGSGKSLINQRARRLTPPSIGVNFCAGFVRVPPEHICAPPSHPHDVSDV